LILARSDARQAESLEEALWRAAAFADAGRCLSLRAHYWRAIGCVIVVMMSQVCKLGCSTLLTTGRSRK
jgi:hypothetical protein